MLSDYKYTEDMPGRQFHYIRSGQTLIPQYDSSTLKTSSTIHERSLHKARHETGKVAVLGLHALVLLLGDAAKFDIAQYPCKFNDLQVSSFIITSLNSASLLSINPELASRSWAEPRTAIAAERYKQMPTSAIHN